MNITKDNTVAEVVTDNIKTADVFKKYGIDFCCGGGVSIEKACAKKGVEFSTLDAEFQKLDAMVTQQNDFGSWKLDFLADYIENVHHAYVAENSPILLQYANRVAEVHGHHYTETVEIGRLINEVIQELTSHMKKEELILFPYIKQLCRAEKEGTALKPPHFGEVNNPIKMMEDEHESAGNVFKRIADLSNNHTPPESACNTFKALYAKIAEFEQDLHQHIHLENNILFPKAIALEKKIRG